MVTVVKFYLVKFCTTYRAYQRAMRYT